MPAGKTIDVTCCCRLFQMQQQQQQLRLEGSTVDDTAVHQRLTVQNDKLL